MRWRPRARPLAAGATIAFLGLCGFLGVRVATDKDPALAVKVASRDHDSEFSGGVGVLLDIAGTVLGGEGESSRDELSNPATGTSG